MDRITNNISSNPNNASTIKILYFYYLKVFSFLAVLVGYLSIEAITLKGPEISPILLNVLITLSSFKQIAMALFFMMAGAIMLNPPYQFSFKKNLYPLIIALLSTTILAKIYLYFFYDYKFSLENIVQIFFSPSTTYLSFVDRYYALVTLTLMTYILRELIVGLDSKHYLYILLMYVFFSLPNLLVYLGIHISQTNSSTFMFNINFVSYLTGYYLTHCEKPKYFKRGLLAMFVLILVVLALNVMETAHYSPKLSLLTIILKDFASLDIANLLISIIIFLFFKLSPFFTRPSRLFKKVSHLTLEAVMISTIVYLLIKSYIVLDVSIVSIFSYSILTFVFSYVMAFVLSPLYFWRWVGKK